MKKTKTIRTTGAWIVAEVMKHIRRDPARIVRLDIAGPDLRAASKAASDAWVKIGLPYTLTRHPDAALRRQGIFRVAFCGPQHQMPAPIKTVTIGGLPRTKDRNAFRFAVRDKAQKLRARLQREYGPEYYVEYAPSAVASECGCRLWHGADWLARETLALYPAEVAGLVTRHIGTREHFEGLAFKWVSWNMCRNKKAARLGGIATAHYKDDEIRTAFADYKPRHPKSGITEAVENLVKPSAEGHPHLEKYSKGGLWKRVTNDAAKEGKSPSEWYASL
jgi:hypothetical protein